MAGLVTYCTLWYSLEQIMFHESQKKWKVPLGHQVSFHNCLFPPPTLFFFPFETTKIISSATVQQYL